MLRQALVHRSYLNESPGFEASSNERLEFLGDSVLGFIAASYLYDRFPEAAEGRLTDMRTSLVRTAALSQAARTLGLGQALQMGKGEEQSGGRTRPSILEATFEAVVAAIYLDQGIETARRFVLQQLSPQLALLDAGAGHKSAKSALQEHTQQYRQLTPTYHTVSAVGPDHAKVFTVEVRLGEEGLSQGVGKSKREAEEAAALAALERLRGPSGGPPRPRYGC